MDFPLVEDDLYPPPASELTRRSTARAIIYRAGRVCLAHVETDDIFGHRNHYETIGGGIEVGETAVSAIKREMAEEAGVTGRIAASLGTVGVQYNLLKRIDVADFFLVEALKIETPHPTEYEKSCHFRIDWLDFSSALSVLSSPHPGSVDRLIYKRDLLMLKKALAIISRK